MKTINLKIIAQIYKKSYYRDDQKLKNLDIVDFVATIWQLKNGHFQSVPFSNKSFLRYLINDRDGKMILLINEISDKRQIIQNTLIS